LKSLAKAENALARLFLIKFRFDEEIKGVFCSFLERKEPRLSKKAQTAL